MQRERITLPIYNLGGGGAPAIEHALILAPGVLQAYVNPLTEMAYVVYDPALANPEHLRSVIDRMGYGAPRAEARHSSEENTMNDQHTSPTNGIGAFLRSPKGLVVLAFLVIAGFYLITEHTAHVVGLLPYTLILLCPILHLLMHGGHGGHAGRDNHAAHQAERTNGDQR